MGEVDVVAEPIADRVKTVDGVTTPSFAAGRALQQDAVAQSDVGQEQARRLRRSVARTLLDGEPRVALFAQRGDSPSDTGVSITPYMLLPGDAQIVADRLTAVLAHPPQRDAASPPKAPAADLTGHWDVQIQFAAGRSHHALHLRQQGNDIDGTPGEFVSRDLTGTIDGDSVRLHSSYDEAHGDALNFTFTGKVTRDSMSGHARHGRVP